MLNSFVEGRVTSAGELEPGQLLIVVGNQGADGRIAAQSVLIAPEIGRLFRSGQQGARRGRGVGRGAGGPGASGAAPTETPPPAFDQERQRGSYEGIAFVVTEDSEATFTVRERLALLPLPNKVDMRTTALSGEIHFDGRPSSVVINLHQLTSGQRLRDGYVRGRMFRDHPAAIFTLENVGPLPEGFAEGEEVTVKITGHLNIRGVEVPLSFDVKAKDEGGVIAIQGRTSFVWDDFGMSLPTAVVVLSVGDEVKVQIDLAVRALR